MNTHVTTQITSIETALKAVRARRLNSGERSQHADVTFDSIALGVFLSVIVFIAGMVGTELASDGQLNWSGFVWIGAQLAAVGVAVLWARSRHSRLRELTARRSELGWAIDDAYSAANHSSWNSDELRSVADAISKAASFCDWRGSLRNPSNYATNLYRRARLAECTV